MVAHPRLHSQSRHQPLRHRLLKRNHLFKTSHPAAASAASLVADFDAPRDTCAPFASRLSFLRLSLSPAPASAPARLSPASRPAAFSRLMAAREAAQLEEAEGHV